jgi:hypothetical protein
MKIKLRHLFIALALLALANLNSQLATVFAQGSLMPPGAPAPTMKSLDQIEPRTPITTNTTPGDASDSFIISQPGSYYLTTNIVGAAVKNGIEISSGNVTLDLNGFALVGSVANSDNGIYVSGTYTNITVRNGTISGWGESGVDAFFGGSPRNLLFADLNVSANTQRGIYTKGPCVVRDCFCQGNHFDGIQCNPDGLIYDCKATDNGQVGIEAWNSVVRNCWVKGNGSYGIYIRPGSVSGCFIENNVLSGIAIEESGSEVVGNTCIGNNTSVGTTDGGISVCSSNNRIEDNHISASGYAGIYLAGNPYTNSIVVKNNVSGNGANNYLNLTPAFEVAGPLINMAGTITNLNPWANFSF